MRVHNIVPGFEKMRPLPHVADRVGHGLHLNLIGELLYAVYTEPAETAQAKCVEAFSSLGKPEHFVIKLVHQVYSKTATSKTTNSEFI